MRKACPERTCPERSRRSRRVLITGGAGFIGTNLVEYYLKHDWKVIIYDNLSRKNTEKNLVWLKAFKNRNLKVVIGDIRNFKKIKKEAIKAEVIFHLAGQTAVTKSIENPRQDFEINALGTLNVLEAVRKAGNKPIIIYASSNKVYGRLQDIPSEVSENQPLDFCSPYACSKGAGDQYMIDYYRSFGLKTVVFRQSCIYGCHQLGTEDQGWIAHFCRQAINNRPITIFGNGRQVRDVLWADDLIKAYDLAVENIDRIKGEVFNIGGGLKNSLSLLELVELLEKRLERKINIRFKKQRLGDQKMFISDNSKLKKVLGWKPKVGKEEGIGRLLEWIRREL